MAHRPMGVICLTLLIVLLSVICASAAIEILDASYRPDRILPEFNVFWDDGYRWGDAYGTPTASGALAIYVRNNGTSSISINDVTIDGASLVSSKSCGTTSYKCGVPCGYKNNATLMAAGEPLWWHADPNIVPPGGTTEIFVRMRSRVAKTIVIIVRSSAGNVVAPLVVDSNGRPRVAGCALSSDSTKLFLYLRHPIKGKLPTKIFVDGVDKTSSCTIVGDSDYDLVAVKCNLTSAFARGSFHCFSALYDDGSKAYDGLRMFYDNFKYGRWGSPPVSSTEDDRLHLIDMGEHSMNLQKGPNVGDYSRTPAGLAIMDQYGMKKIYETPTTDRLYAIFLCDEPDLTEEIQPTEMEVYTEGVVGALSQNLSDQSLAKKTSYSQYPTMLNLNGSFKPYNYLIYGHVADIISADPYYQNCVAEAYWTRQNTIPQYSKATFIYGVASNLQAACEPSPMHLVISSSREHDAVNSRVFRWATPEEKRIEVYYALAAGAKQITYWWFTNVLVTKGGNSGIGDADEPGSAALWREMGLLGAEIGMASQVLVNSCPVSVDITKPGKLMTKALVNGVDTLLLLCINDDYAVDDAGAIVRSIKHAEVSMELPGWVSSPTNVFEIDYTGIRDVPYDVSGSRIDLHLGRVEITRMILITKDSSLKGTLQTLYTNTYRPRVSQLIPLPE